MEDVHRRLQRDRVRGQLPERRRHDGPRGDARGRRRRASRAARGTTAEAGARTAVYGVTQSLLCWLLLLATWDAALFGVVRSGHLRAVYQSPSGSGWTAQGQGTQQYSGAQHTGKFTTARLGSGRGK